MRFSVGIPVLFWLLVIGVSFSSAIPADVDCTPAAQAVDWSWQYNHIYRRDFTKVPGKGASRQGFIKASYGVGANFYLDGKIGVGDITYRRADGIIHRFPAGFTGGYGFRCRWPTPLENVTLMPGFQHISAHPFKHMVDDVAYRAIWDEWQGSVAVLWQRKQITVYGGPRYSTCQLKFRQGDFRRRLKTAEVWGMFCGVMFRPVQSIIVSGELRMFEERAVNFGMAIVW